MSATRRGFYIFAGLVVFTAIFCVYLPFFGLPKAGIGVGLPWITLPADVLKGNILPSFLGSDFTNSMTSLLVVDVILLLIGFTVRRAVLAQAPDRFVPRGLSNGIEMLVEFWYNTARTNVGKYATRVVPLALTVFLFVLVGNWIELIPGFETVGVMSCAEKGVAGYPINGALLNVSSLDLKGRAGTTASQEDQDACEAKYNGTNGNLDYRAPGVIAKEERGEGVAPAAAGTTGTTAGKTAAANPNLFNVVPYFRALATDLNMPLALAIIVFLTVQIWGIQALGGAYFFKFFNIPALGNISKNPMGAMDFVVGLIDIISELSRLISLSFRLLGNIFAGSVLLAVMTFLVAGGLPVAFYGLELFAGAIQAYVFAILVIMYASQAVFAHHSEDEHDSAEEAHAAHASEPVAQPVSVM